MGTPTVDATIQSILIAVGALLTALFGLLRLWVTAKGQLTKKAQEIELDWKARQQQIDQERQSQQIAHDREMDQQLASMRDQIEDWKTYFAQERDLRIKQDAAIADRDKRDESRRLEIEGLRSGQEKSDRKIDEMGRQISGMQQESAIRQEYVSNLEKERDEALDQVTARNSELKTTREELDTARGELNTLRLDLKITQDKLQGTQEDLKSTQNELEEMFRRLYALENKPDTGSLDPSKVEKVKPPDNKIEDEKKE